MPLSPKIIELRKILAERYPRQTELPVPCVPPQAGLRSIPF